MGNKAALQEFLEALDRQAADHEAKSPPGWEKTVEKMKDHKEIDNPFALAWSMKNKGDKPHEGNKKAMSPKSAVEEYQQALMIGRVASRHSNKEAKNFSSPEALQKYLADHPKANKSKHKVDKGGPAKKAPKKDAPAKEAPKSKPKGKAAPKHTPHTMRDKAEDYAKSGKHDEASIHYQHAATMFKNQGNHSAAKSMEDASRESAKKHQKSQKKKK